VRALLVWLRSTELQQAPAMSGLWGELPPHAPLDAPGCSRCSRATSGCRTSAALQASPNGVVLLDARAASNGATRFRPAVRFDAERDVLQSIGNLVRDPAVQCLFCAQDFAQPVLMQGRESTASRPVKLSVQLYGYGEGRKLLLARDVTALEQAEAMRRDFVANVSHEIRTPLTVLAGFVETLQNLPLEEDERRRFWPDGPAGERMQPGAGPADPVAPGRQPAARAQ
jgi:two-component system phosphate regulon sensor histidine kinase PhoR